MRCGKAHFRHIGLLLSVVLFSVGGGTGAQEATSSDEGKSDVKRLLPYCGVNCLYAALLERDIPVTYKDLLKPEYFSARRGSTLGDLKKAAEDSGGAARVVANLSVADLRSARIPLILHVKREPAATRYEHYVLCLGVEGSQALLLDPPGAVQRVGLSGLLQVWDGYAVAVGTDRVELSGLTHTGLSRFASIAVVITLLVLAARTVLTPSRGREAQLGWRVSLKSSLKGALAFLLLSTCVGFAYHLFSPVGFFHETETLETMQDVYLGSFLERTTADRIRAGFSRETVIVDARYNIEYESGHLPGAINLPPDTPLERCKETLSDVPRGTPLVVYCQSAGCPYAVIVARRLRKAGYEHISLFKGGWEAWAMAEEGGRS